MDTIDEKALFNAERALAGGVPFGSFDYISKRTLDQYAGLLSKLADAVPGARVLHDCIDEEDGGPRRRTLGDPLVRRTIEDGACLHLLGRDVIGERELNDVLTAAAEYARRRRGPLLAEATGCHRIGGAPHHGHLWTASEDSGPAARRFVAQCLSRLPGVRIERPTDEAVGNVVEGTKLVDVLLPDLGRSTLSHTFMIVVATSVGEFDFDSLTVPGIPGVIFLSPKVLTSPVRAADAVFHESMHLKLMDIDYAEHLYAVGFRPQLSPTITPPWHSGDQKQQWPLDRILTAMHVYTGLAVFFGRLELAKNEMGERRDYPTDSVMKYQRATERARVLLDTSKEHLDVFSAAGRSFIEWMAEVHAYLGAPRGPQRTGSPE